VGTASLYDLNSPFRPPCHPRAFLIRNAADVLAHSAAVDYFGDRKEQREAVSVDYSTNNIAAAASRTNATPLEVRDAGKHFRNLLPTVFLLPTFIAYDDFILLLLLLLLLLLC